MLQLLLAAIVAQTGLHKPLLSEGREARRYGGLHFEAALAAYQQCGGANRSRRPIGPLASLIDAEIPDSVSLLTVHGTKGASASRIRVR